ITHIHRLEAERAGRMIEFGKMAPHDRPESRAFFTRHGFPIEQFNPTGMRPAWMGTSMFNPVTQPDKYIDDHDVIKIGDRELEVIWTPGHSPGHNVIYLRKEKVMIVGDHLLPKITPHVGIYPDNPEGNPLGEFIASQWTTYCRHMAGSIMIIVIGPIRLSSIIVIERRKCLIW